MQEIRVQSLNQEDHLAKEMATHFSILAREIPQTEAPGGIESMGFALHLSYLELSVFLGLG